MADGGLRIPVELNISKAEKDLEKLKEKIYKAENALNANAQKKSAIEAQLGKAGYEADKAKEKVLQLKEALANTRSRDEKASLRTQLAEATEEQRILTRESNRLNDEYVKLTQKIEQGTKDLTDMKDAAGDMERQIAAARPGEAISQALENAEGKLKRFFKNFLQIATIAKLISVLKGAITDCFNEYLQYDKELQRSLKELDATGKAIKVTLGSAFAGIYKSAILPIVQKIANWMLEAANAAARFVAILSGQSSYKRAVVNTEEVAASMEDVSDEADNVAESAKEAKKQLMGFDELNILDDNETSNSGSNNEKPDDSKPDGIDIIEEAIDMANLSNLDKLALSIRDLLFNWDDLNPEQIATKIISGLSGILFAALGIMLGFGPGGVLMMTLAGILLGLIASNIIFNHDGKIDSEEWGKMVMLAISGLLVGVGWFLITGSPAAGIVGTILGAALALSVMNLLFDNNGHLDGNELLNLVFPVLNALIAGAVGFAITKNKYGAGLGMTVGFALTMLFESFSAKAEGKYEDAQSAIIGMVNSVLLGIAGFKIGTAVAAGSAVAGPVGALIGVVAGIGLTMVIESVKATMAAKQAFYDSEFGQQVTALQEQIKKTLETSEDLIVHINSITGEVDESTLVDLKTAQGLVDEIFKLDAEQNKTPGTIAQIKADIEALNGMGIPGVFLTFDEATNEVNGTHEALTHVLDDLLKQYQLEAMKEAYIEALKAQTQAELENADAKHEGEKAIEAYNEALLKQEEAYKELERAREEYNTNAGLGGSSEKLQEAKDAVKAAEEGVKATKEAAKAASDAMDTSSEAIDLAGQKVDIIAEKYSALVGGAQEVGSAIGDGAVAGYKETEGKLGEEVSRSQEEIQADLKDIWQTNSPSKVTEEMGENIVQGFEEGVKAEAPTLVTQIHSMFEDIIQEMTESIKQMKNLFNFEWSIPRPKIPKIKWNIKSVSYGNGQSVSIPEFFVEWYARGGVFNFPQLIGVGENGKEAVVPLEKNTEWMNLVADGLMQRIRQSNFANELAAAFANTPRPAMAGGSIIPPNTLRNSSAIDGIEDALKQGIVDAFTALNGDSSNRNINLQININGKAFARATYSDYKAVEKEHGISMINA